MSTIAPFHNRIEKIMKLECMWISFSRMMYEDPTALWFDLCLYCRTYVLLQVQRKLILQLCLMRIWESFVKRKHLYYIILPLKYI